MTSPTTISFAGLPSTAPAIVKVLLSKKPYIAPEGTRIEPVQLYVKKVRLSPSHLRRYQEICGAPFDRLPPAYLHTVAMPLHMQLFVVKNFPVKVLGLIHLRNTIRVLGKIDVASPLSLTVLCDTMRLTDYGQEYDFTTRYEQDGRAVWEEVSTMFARGKTAPKEGTKRPSIERSTHPASDVSTETLDIAENTGWRYAKISGDFNPIHLTARTASMFGFKQPVAHGMWSLGRCLGSAAAQLPERNMQVDTQFKLPVYLPSQALARTWPVSNGVDISMSTPRGDRLHLAMQVRSL
jgi:acyl dehydratase